MPRALLAALVVGRAPPAEHTRVSLEPANPAMPVMTLEPRGLRLYLGDDRGNLLPPEPGATQVVASPAPPEKERGSDKRTASISRLFSIRR